MSPWHTPWVESSFRSHYPLTARFRLLADPTDVCAEDWALLRVPRSDGSRLGPSALAAMKVRRNEVQPWEPNECAFVAGFARGGHGDIAPPSVAFGDIVGAIASLVRSSSAGLPYTNEGYQTKGAAIDAHLPRIEADALLAADGMFGRGEHVGAPCVPIQKDELGPVGKVARVLMSPPISVCVAIRAHLDVITSCAYRGRTALGFNCTGSDWGNMRQRFLPTPNGYSIVCADAEACDASLSPAFARMVADVWELTHPGLLAQLRERFGAAHPFHNFFQCLLSMPMCLGSYECARSSGNPSGQTLTTEVNSDATLIVFARMAYAECADQVTVLPPDAAFEFGRAMRVAGDGPVRDLIVYGDDSTALVRNDHAFSDVAGAARKCGFVWTSELEDGPVSDFPMLGRTGPHAVLSRHVILNMAFYGKRGDNGTVYNERLRAALSEAARYDSDELYQVVRGAASRIAARHGFVLLCDVGLDLSFPTLHDLARSRSVSDHGPCADPRTSEGINISVFDLTTECGDITVAAH